MATQYVVPQFIDAEDKIIGPITVRQFIEMLVVGVIEFVLYKALTFITFVLFGLLVLGAGLVLAFSTVNGQAFHLFLLNVFITLKRPKLRIWFRDYNDSELRQFIQKAPPPPVAAQITKARPEFSKLSELSLIVNTGGAYQGEAEEVKDLDLK